MFSLHERNQRKVCRAAFVLLCAVPTLVTLCWVLYFHRPWQEHDWRQSLESTLHVRVEVDGVSAPRPHQRQIRLVRLADLPSARPLIELHELRISGDNVMKVERAVVYGAQLDRLAQTVQIWCAEEGDSYPSLWQFEQVTVTGGNGITSTFEDLHCQTKSNPQGAKQCTMRAHYDGKLIRMSIERDSAGEVRTSVDAQAADLPAWLLAEAVPGADRWKRASFSGTLHLEQGVVHNRGEFNGQIRSLDTQVWLGSNLIQSTITLQFDAFSWSDGKVELVQGNLEGGDGQISNALLLALKDKFFCSLPNEPLKQEQEQFQPFNRLGCRFHLSEDGITLSGAFPLEDGKRAMALIEGKPLVLQPAYSRLPLAYFIEVVCAPTDFKMPATREATNIAEKLPLPPQSATKK